MKRHRRLVVGILGAVLVAAGVSLVLSVGSGADAAGSCRPVKACGHQTHSQQMRSADAAGGRRPRLGDHALTTSTELGPVLREVFAALGTKFFPARGARPKIHKQAAVHDALSTAPWPGCATGISLVRTEPTRRVPRGSLVWLVSMHPSSRIGPDSGPVPHGWRGSGHQLTVNFAVVVIDAHTGRFVESEDGYSNQLPAWRRLPSPGCQAH